MAQESKQDRLVIIKQAVVKLKKESKQQCNHIVFESFGTDKNKVRKNKQSCDRGSSSGAARYCSIHLREIFPSNIIDDNNESEFCAVTRHNEECCMLGDNKNPCYLCNINEQQYIKTDTINIAEAICEELNGSKKAEKLKRRLLAFMVLYIGTDYPAVPDGKKQSKQAHTTLRITINDTKWIEYYIKLTSFSSMLKTSTPSGYKYKDRISLGSMIRIQGNSNKDAILYLTKDPQKEINPEIEKQRPVVNGVGFWNLTNKGGIRNIIHLNEYQALNICFGFLIKSTSTSIKSIKVELICTGYSMENEALLLWSYPVTKSNETTTTTATCTSSSLYYDDAQFDNDNFMSHNYYYPYNVWDQNHNVNIPQIPMHILSFPEISMENNSQHNTDEASQLQNVFGISASTPIPTQNNNWMNMNDSTTVFMENLDTQSMNTSLFPNFVEPFSEITEPPNKKRKLQYEDNSK